jgi:opacity protein-like surface antigen
MKSAIRGAVLGLAVVLSAQAAQAQGLSFGVGGGVVLPTGDLGEGLSTGWSGTAQMRVKPPVSPLGFQVDAFYTRFGFDGGEGHSRMIGGTANALFAFPSASPARPYVVGGVGLYNSKASIDGAESQTKFGLNAGAGFDFGLGSANLFAEGRFHMIMKAIPDGLTGDQKAGYMIPLTVGLRF